MLEGPSGENGPRRVVGRLPPRPRKPPPRDKLFAVLFLRRIQPSREKVNRAALKKEHRPSACAAQRTFRPLASSAAQLRWAHRLESLCSEPLGYFGDANFASICCKRGSLRSGSQTGSSRSS